MKRYSLISITISLACIAGTIFQDFRLAKMYKAADGKTKLLFGFVEIGELQVKVNLGIFLFISLLVWLYAIRKKENKDYLTTAIVFILLSMILLCSRFWRILI